MLQDMRGLFFIVQGQYRTQMGPRFQNPVTNSVNWCGGYDPENTDTAKWFMLFDWATLTCHRAASDLDYVLEGVVHTITKYRTKDRLVNTIKGLHLSASPAQQAFDEHLGHLYGEHFADRIREMEDRAYTLVKESDPVFKARKRLRKKVSTPVEMVTRRNLEVCAVATPTKKRGLRPKKRSSVVEFE